ncbi:MAG: acyl-ACP--UDP-N-acetylglucosamine O-acyltransferase [Fibrobacterota bacterium]
MSVQIDERAVVDSTAQLGKDVTVGPFAVIEKNTVIGDSTEIGPGARIGANTTLGRECRVFNGASIGTIAQDLKYAGEEAFLEIGDRGIFREFVTVNRGTAANDGYTRIGNDAALLAYCHVGHDCEIGDNFISSNGLAMAGHVTVGDMVICGGNVSVHQFCRIGDHAFIGANKYLTMDAVPYALIAGNALEPAVYGLNRVGLKRRGFTKEDMQALKKAFRILFRSAKTVADALQEIRTDLAGNEHVSRLISFVEQSNRGLIRMNK